MTNYFSKNLKYLREQKNMEQQDLAEAWNIPRSTLSCWENGLRTPKIEQIQDIANYFGVNIDIVSRDYSQINATITNNKDQKEILKQVLKSKGILDDDDNITQEDFDRLMKFIDNNKDFLIKK